MVTTFYPPYHFGGDATYVKALSEHLVARGHDVTVVHCENAFRLQARNSEVAAPEEENGVRVHRIRKRAGALSPLITQQFGVPGLKSAELRRLFAEDFDVVNFHNISLIGGPGIIPMSRAPINLYTLHEHWLVCATHIFWKNRRKACDARQCIRCSIRSGIPPQWWRYTPFVERCLKHIDRFIAPSDYTARRHRDYLPLRAPVDVIPLFSGIDPGPPADAPGPRPLNFVYVGRMTAAKGVAELVAAFARWPQYQLTLLGEGDLQEELRDRYAACSNIQFLGAVPQSTLVDYYRRACAVILPSLAPETFGLTVVEAFACGTPAIVRAAGGNRETVDTSGAGFVYNNEAELRAALDAFSRDNNLRERLGKVARKAFERHYTAQLHIERYLGLVDAVRDAKYDLIETVSG